MNNSAVYMTKDAARSACRYLRGPQIESVGALRVGDNAYTPIIMWKDGSESFLKIWQAEWFSLYKEN